MKIDAHQHFWHYAPDDYDWISDQMQILHRDFLPNDLLPTIRAADIGGVVTVQARQTVEETKWLLELASAHDFIQGVVGWVPLASQGTESVLDRFSSDDHLTGVRHVLHDESENDYMLRADFNRGIDLLQKYDLAYDILIFARHLPQTITFVDRHPNQVFVLNHIAKPRIAAKKVETWKTHLTQLAKREHCYCKISGMVTEADWDTWTLADLRPYWRVVLDAFGPERLMFGSDWPVCRLACDYSRWRRVVERFIAPLSGAEKDRILGGTATEVYQLETRV
jgi:L-fuconolactonase